jgi:sarcosine oxidase subunit beta
LCQRFSASNILDMKAEIVIVGGGALGTSIAYALAEAGVTDVVLVDAAELGGGSSGKPLGGLRGTFSDALNVALAARSLEHYRRLGPELGFERVGYLFLLRTSEQVERLEASVALQNELGVPNRLIGAAEAHALAPLIDPDRYLAATYCPTDGHARPRAAISHWAQHAQRRGVRVLERCAVRGIDVRGGEIAGVHTTRGTIATSTVICAAGAWSARVGAMAGIPLDVRPIRRQIAFSEPGGHPGVPFTIDLETSFYFHNAGDGMLLGYSDPAQPAGFHRTYDPRWLGELRRLAATCAPALADIPLAPDGWAGLYEMTPDANALIGEARDVSRFLYATGFSGHGFSQAPAAGEVIRDLVLGEQPFADITALRAERFAERASILEATIV